MRKVTCSILDTELHAQILHLAEMARNPGSIDHARLRAKELEQVWPGISKMVKAELESSAKIVGKGIDGQQ